MTDYRLVGEYIPLNLIGMVKSSAQLTEPFSAVFHLENELVLGDEIVILLGRARQNP